jgi:diaminobutyrate-2-oxoglutarate transaminase
MDTFERLESEVRSYSRSFPAVFDTAQGCQLTDEGGRTYLDFFAGAGSLNYGHNPEGLRRKLLAYIERKGVVHTLDMASVAKREFMETFESVVLKPRTMDYKLQFPGPTGTNAVEAALKLARKATKRTNILYFSNAFHGMTLGSLAVTRAGPKREGAGVPLEFTDAIPYAGSMGDEDTLEHVEAFILERNGTGDYPAAIILETIQAEGGVNIASHRWLRRLAELAKRLDVLLVVDDIQVGCGRTGPFFSFEPAGIQPDIVCLSKSLSGYGLPLALVLLKPEIDVWEPGEHSGTFRGHNPAFVTATEALRTWWTSDALSAEVERKGEHVRRRLDDMIAGHPAAKAEIRGRGLIQAIASQVPGLSKRISREAFERGLIAETCGPDGYVLKLLPPLVIDDASLDRGLDIVAESLQAALAEHG